MNDGLSEFLSGAGWFLYPLLACSLVAVVVILERLLALREAEVLPPALLQRVMAGRVGAGAAPAVSWEPSPAASDQKSALTSRASAAERLVHFMEVHRPEADTLKAFAWLEITRLERGLYLLDIVVGAAPLLGLLGTVAGLVQVFSGIDPASGLPDALVFVGGIAMALSTTLLGLAIALPALIGSGYLHRRADLLAAKLNLLTERLVELLPREEASEVDAGR